MDELTGLPGLALERVLSFLEDVDVLSFAGCCRRSRDASLEDAVWKPRCEAFGVGLPGTWEQAQLPASCSTDPGSAPQDTAAGQKEDLGQGAGPSSQEPVNSHEQAYSYRMLYLGLLRRYGYLLADASAPAPGAGALRLWQAMGTPFGGLVVARFEPPGAIVLYSIIVYRLNGPVQGRAVLRITPQPPPAPSRPSAADPPSPSPPASDAEPPAPPPAPPAPPSPSNLLQGLVSLMTAAMWSPASAASPGDASSPPSPAAGEAQATSPSQVRCCCNLPVPAAAGLEEHDATLHPLPPLGPSGDGFALRCAHRCCHTDFDPLLRHTGGLGSEVDVRLQDIPESRRRLEQAELLHGSAVPEIAWSYARMCSQQFVPHHMRFLHGRRTSSEGGAPSARLKLPAGVPEDALVYRSVQVGQGHPLAGLWRGTFAFHGVEILNFVPSEPLPPPDACSSAPPPPSKLLGVKVTGDANVPASQVSIEVLLSAPHPRPASAPGRPFVLPAHCSSGLRVESVEGLVVEAVYEGRGHIAQTGFQHDEWTDAEIVVFSKGLCIGAIWHELGSFSLFSRLPL